MDYYKTNDKHIITLDDYELESLINALNSCDLPERRTFGGFLGIIKEKNK